MKAKTLFYNGRIHTMANELVVDSMAVCRDRIVAVGNRLERDTGFSSYDKIDLRGRTVTPGFVDAHTHFFGLAMLFGQVDLDGLNSLDKCLARIREFSSRLPRKAWVTGTGYAPDRFVRREEPDRYMLDKVTGGRPAMIFSKDQHTAWVNSPALELAGITAATRDPEGGRILRLSDGCPSGILRETSAYLPVSRLIPEVSRREKDRCYKLALDLAYRKGVTGVHSFDGPEAFPYFAELAERNKLGLRITHYPLASLLDQLERTNTVYGTGTDWFRVAGVKVFADGSLGSQSACCFNKYLGSRDNRGVEVTTVPQMKRIIRRAGKLGLPCAVHAIGDRAISNVLDAMASPPAPRGGARHRIEHLQMVRRKDLPRLKRLGIVASMQPSHCPSDIDMVRKYWGRRGANAYIFKTVLDRKIDLAFGSDAPIEPLDPLAGMAAAVRRARPGSRDVFYPEQRITAAEALRAFTVGPAVASGQAHNRGYLLPDYPADFVVLSQDITRVAPTRLYDTSVLATVVAGTVRYQTPTLRW